MSYFRCVCALQLEKMAWLWSLFGENLIVIGVSNIAFLVHSCNEIESYKIYIFGGHEFLIYYISFRRGRNNEGKITSYQ